MESNKREFYIMSVVYLFAFGVYFFLSAPKVASWHYIAEFCFGLLSVNLIVIVNRQYLLKRYKHLSFEKLCDNVRFFYDTLIVIFAGWMAADIAALPIYMCSNNNISLIEIQFSQIVLFLVCITFSLIYHTILYTHLYVKQNVKLEKLAKDKISSEIKYLQSQFSPELIFNTIEHVESMLPDGKKIAQDVLDKFSSILRYKIYEVNKRTISLSDEISYICMYTELLKELKLANVTVTAKPPQEDILLKPLVLQSVIDYFVSQKWTDFSINSEEKDKYYLMFSCNCVKPNECLQQMFSFFDDIRYRQISFDVFSEENKQTIKLSFN